MKLLSVSSDAKTVKGESRGYLTGVLYLAPSTEVQDGLNVCPFASPGCKSTCLYTAGRASVFPAIPKARRARRKLYRTDRARFDTLLCHDIDTLIDTAARRGLIPCVRLNGTSDLVWDGIIRQFPHVQFYDYTKIPARMERYLAGELPSNYHLTFSRSETNDALCPRYLARGGNVAVVFDQPIPDGGTVAQLWGSPRAVINGDASDLRFNDPGGVIVGLNAKGRARQDRSGFVLRGVLP